jgi:chemotaxis protein methyltransferase CheR
MSWYLRLKALIVSRIGLELPPEPSIRLRDAVRRRVELLHLASEGQYVEEVSRSEGSEEWQSLLGAVLNNRTWFYRDAEQLRVIRILIESLARRHGHLYVWSAGCSTGEEAYTLAMLMLEAGIEGHVLGTDLSADCIAAAEAGYYPQSAVRALPHRFRSQFLRERGSSFQIGPDVRGRVTFDVHNLVDRVMPRPVLRVIGGASPPARRTGTQTPPDGGRHWHLIVCRNVFLYFEPRIAQSTAERLALELEVDGALVLGGADSLVAGGRLTAKRVEDRLVFTRIEPRSISSGSLLTVSPSPSSPPLRIRPSSSSPWLTKPGPPKCPEEKTDTTNIVSVLESEVEAHPLRSDLRLALGAALSTEGLRDRAALELKRALFLDPKCWPAAYLLGGVLRQQGKIPESSRQYQNTLRLLTAEGALAYSGVGGVELDPREVVRALTAILGSPGAV